MPLTLDAQEADVSSKAYFEGSTHRLKLNNPSRWCQGHSAGRSRVLHVGALKERSLSWR